MCAENQASSHPASDSALRRGQGRLHRTGRCARVAKTPAAGSRGRFSEPHTGRSWPCAHRLPCLLPAPAQALPRGPSLRQVFIIIFDNKLRLQGTQFAVNFHFLLPGAQGSSGPGKGKPALCFLEQRWCWPQRSRVTQTFARLGLQPLQDTLHSCDHAAFSP